jgi:hypothetical protein
VKAAAAQDPFEAVAQQINFLADIEHAFRADWASGLAREAQGLDPWTTRYNDIHRMLDAYIDGPSYVTPTDLATYVAYDGIAEMDGGIF